MLGAASSCAAVKPAATRSTSWRCWSHAYDVTSECVPSTPPDCTAAPLPPLATLVQPVTSPVSKPGLVSRFPGSWIVSVTMSDAVVGLPKSIDRSPPDVQVMPSPMYPPAQVHTAAPIGSTAQVACGL